MASPTVAMGEELEVIQTELLGFKSIAGDAQVKLTTAWPDEPTNTSSLLTIASRRELVAAAGPDAIILAKTDTVRKAFEAPCEGETEARSVTPLATMPVSYHITHIAFTTDEKYLLVSGNNENGVAAYETTSLVNGEKEPAFELVTGKSAVRALCPNVALEKAELCAVVTETGALHMINLSTKSISGVLVSDAKCVSWSTKGKQLVAGRSNGTIQQLTPEGEIKAEIPCPDYLSGVHVASLQWLENHLFVAIYMTTNEQPPTSTYYVITRKLPSSYTFRKLTDPVDPFGAEKPPHHTILRLKDFPPNLHDLLVVTSTVSPDVGFLTRSKKPLSTDFDAEAISGVFTTTEMFEDSRRAALPMTASFDNSIPVGVAIDLSARETVYKPIPTEEIDESPGPVPAVWVLNNEGILVAWWIIYNESIKEGATYPQMATMLPDLETTLEVARQPSQPPPAVTSVSSALASAPAAAKPPHFCSASTSMTSAFGVPSALTPTATPAFSAPSVFGAAAKLTFGKPSAFGQPSTFSKAVAAKPSSFGSSSASPAFGQSGFALYSNGKSAFSSASTSTTSPFASAAKSGGFSSFANSPSSGFGALGGDSKSSGSIFGKPSSGSAFGSASSGDSIFKKTDSNASPFGSSSGFKIQSSFAAAVQKDDEPELSNDKSSSLGKSMFGGEFSAALTGKSDDKKSVSFDNKKEEKEEPSKEEPKKSIFGTPSTTGFGQQKNIFGAPSTSGFGTLSNGEAPRSTFGAPKSEAKKDELTRGIFGASKIEEKKSIFGAPYTPATQSTFGAPSTPSNKSIFGAPTSVAEKVDEKREEPKKSIFGASSTARFGASGQQKSIFGAPKEEESTTPEPSTGKTKNVFGAPAKEESTTPQTEAPKTKSMFGAPSTPKSIFGPVKTADSSASKSIFGAPSTGTTKTIFSAPSITSESKPSICGSSSTPQKSIFASVKTETPKNIFGSPSTTTPAARASRESIFGVPSKSMPSGTAVKNPFASLKPPVDETSEEEEDEDASESEPETPGRKNKSKNESMFGKFGPIPTIDATPPSKTSSSSIFNPIPDTSDDNKTPLAKLGKKSERSLFSDSTTPTTTPAPLRYSYRSSQDSPPVPSESTNKNSYEVGGSSSGASKAGVSDDDSTFLKPKSAKGGAKPKTVVEDIPLPLDPPMFSSKSQVAASKPLPDEEGSGVDVPGPGEDSDLDSETSSAIHVSKDISPSSSARTQNSFSSGLNGGFTMVPKPITALAQHEKKEKKTIKFGDARTSNIFPPPVTQTSPRSPSPVRNIGPPRVVRLDDARAVSSCHIGSSFMGRPSNQLMLSKPLGSSILGSKADGRTAQDAFLSANRKAKAKQSLQETAPLVDDEGDEVQRLLASELVPTLQIDQLMAHTDVAPPAQDSIPAQVEAVYRDINSMVDTIGLNARSAKQFVLGHSQRLIDGERNPEDLADDASSWVLCELEDLADMIEVDLTQALFTSRVTDVESKKAQVADLSKSLSRLRAKQQDLEVILACLDPEPLGAIASLPLSPEQSTQQSELRRGFTSFTKQLAAVEEALTVLKTRVAAAAAASGGKGATQPPTVDAVMRTIAKMTSMAEKRSGDVDVLETQLRKLRMSPVRSTRESTPVPTPGAPQAPCTPLKGAPSTPMKRSSLFSPERSRSMLSPGTVPRHGPTTPRQFTRSMMTPLREFGNLSLNLAGSVQGMPRKVSEYNEEERARMVEKARRKRAVLGKLREKVMEKGVSVWEVKVAE